MAKLKDEMEARAKASHLPDEKVRTFRHIKDFRVLLGNRPILAEKGPDGTQDSPPLDHMIGLIFVSAGKERIEIGCDIAQDQLEKDELVTILAAIHLACRDLFPKFRGQITPAMIEKRAKELASANSPVPQPPAKEVDNAQS